MFDYFYDQEIKLFSFIQVPTELVKNKLFESMTDKAKLLYGLMLSRTSLSIRNDWLDTEKRVYIIYPVKEIMENLNCSNKTVAKMLKELENGGLIERKRRGLGKKDIIYVKNFVRKLEDKESGETVEGVDKQKEKNLVLTKKSVVNAENKPFSKKCKVYTSRSVTSTLQEVNNLHLKKCNFYTSRSVSSTLQEVKKGHVMNYIDNKYINNNNINNKYKEAQYNLSSFPQRKKGQEERQKAISLSKAELSEKIGYHALCIDRPNNLTLINELFDLLVDVFNKKSGSERIGGELKSVEEIKERLLKLDKDTFSGVIDRLESNQSNVKNIRAYLLTALYNATFAVDIYYTMLYNQGRNREGEKK